jgi:PelA/Pel-15E family pectate lyase
MLRTIKLISAFLLFATSAPAFAQSRPEIEQTMKRATHFMVDKVSTRGGYVWSYLPDMSRRWGEMEAYPTMAWVQPPGTGTMGHLFLDAYHATGDEYYYQAAAKAAEALIAGQHRSGGWNYFMDYAGPASAKRWYSTIGANAWRLEEFQHYTDNATFDDAGTSEAMQLLLRIYLEKHDPKFKPALDRALNFVLKSQYANGGWPQRWPHDDRWPAYGDYITFNDDVAAENIKFLTMVWQTLGDRRALDSINRAMNIFVITQQPAPQAGWGLQHTVADLKPAGARTYEPKALVTHTTASNIRQLMNFYQMTGDKRFLARIPEALAWLESVRLPKGQEHDGKAFPTFIEIGTNRPLYVHRTGSNIVNGRYYVDYNPEATISHYSAWRAIDLDSLRREYEALAAIPGDVAAKDSPLRKGRQPLPRYFVEGEDAGSDLNASFRNQSAAEIIASLNKDGWWPTELRATSHPYAGPGPRTPVPGDYRTTRVGDYSDTSPYIADKPVIGISTAGYIANMVKLIRALRQASGERG